MKFSWGWLCDYLEPVAGALEKLSDTLIQAGIEVESCINTVSGFEIVEIESFEKHPDSDHLNICKLVGHENKIVCGASNVRAGMRTVLAKIGALIPKNGMQIQPTTIRGVLSHGMLCSRSELGLFTENEIDGIIDIDEKSATIENIMLPNGPIFDVGITPNRGDWLSVYGIAREMSALGLGKLKSPKIHGHEPHKMTYGSEVVDIKDDAILSMYTMEISGTKNQESPGWMKKRLTEVGLNPKSAIVDITNYIAHALGQPLHAFNGDLIKHIDIRRFTGEFVDLKDRKHSIENLPAMISDGVCVSIPGIIGGKYGKCEENSSNILLEAANYSREYIYKAQKMVTTTDASKKFFYDVDPEMTAVALVEGSAMIQKICGGTIKNFNCAKENHVRQNAAIAFPAQYLGDLAIDEDFAHTALNNLGFNRSDSGYVVPSWRHDIGTPESLLTEIVRSYDVKNVHESMFSPTSVQVFEINLESKIREILVSEGLYEILTRDFMSKEMNEIFAQDESLLIANPMTKAQFAVRNSLLPNMIEIFDMYTRYKWDVTGLFDIGPVFIKNNDNISERQRLCIAIPIHDKDWLSSNLNQNFYVAKRLVEKIIRYCFGNEVRSYPVQHNVLENTCEWRSGSTGIAWFGIFGKTDVMKKLKMKSKFYLAEIEIGCNSTVSSAIKVSEQESISKDLSLLLNENILIGDLVEKIKNNLPDVDIKVFDIYPDGDFASEKRSVGLRLYWRHLKKVITSEDLQDMLRIAEKAAEEMGCVVRES